jgi:hypothetical protein
MSSAIIAVTFLQLNHPYLINPRVLKFIVYAATMFLPLFFDILFGLAGIRTGELGFFMISFVSHFMLFYLLCRLFQKAKNKKKFVAATIIFFVLYVTGVVFYMW